MCHYIAFLCATSIKFGNFIANWVVLRHSALHPRVYAFNLSPSMAKRKKTLSLFQSKSYVSDRIYQFRKDFLRFLLSSQPFCTVDLTHFDESIPIFNQLTVFGRELSRQHLILILKVHQPKCEPIRPFIWCQHIRWKDKEDSDCLNTLWLSWARVREQRNQLSAMHNGNRQTQKWFLLAIQEAPFPKFGFACVRSVRIDNYASHSICLVLSTVVWIHWIGAQSDFESCTKTNL